MPLLYGANKGTETTMPRTGCTRIDTCRARLLFRSRTSPTTGSIWTFSFTASKVQKVLFYRILWLNLQAFLREGPAKFNH